VNPASLSLLPERHKITRLKKKKRKNKLKK